MPRKKFETEQGADYDPFAAESKRAAIRAAISTPEERTESKSGGGAELPTLTVTPAAVPTKKKETPKPKEKVTPEPLINAVPQLEKPSTREASGLARSIQRQVVQKRFRVTESEEQQYEEYVLRLRTAAASKVDFSVISRALWTLVQHAESEVVESLKKVELPKRPGKHDIIAQAEYEEQWVRILSTALRRAAPVK